MLFSCHSNAFICSFVISLWTYILTVESLIRSASYEHCYLSMVILSHEFYINYLSSCEKIQVPFPFWSSLMQHFQALGFY